MATIKVLRVDGSVETFEHEKVELERLYPLVDTDCFDTVMLRKGKVMLVDDNGYFRKKPVNKKATELYHEVCKPGVTHQIVGDVVIVNDADME